MMPSVVVIATRGFAGDWAEAGAGTAAARLAAAARARRVRRRSMGRTYRMAPARQRTMVSVWPVARRPAGVSAKVSVRLAQMRRGAPAPAISVTTSAAAWALAPSADTDTAVRIAVSRTLPRAKVLRLCARAWASVLTP